MENEKKQQKEVKRSERMLKANRNLKKLQETIEPFTRKKRFRRPSSDGEWSSSFCFDLNPEKEHSLQERER